MSAPWEVWVREYSLGYEPRLFLKKPLPVPEEEGADVPLAVSEEDDAAFAEVGTSRYMRADLTCGECARRKKTCPHFAYAAPSNVKPSSPACIAFKPKEVTE